MRGHFKHGFWCGFGFPLFGFPRRKAYLCLLEEYKEELKEMQREIAEELKEVEREIEELKRRRSEGAE
jgi:hypothetical protein